MLCPWATATPATSAAPPATAAIAARSRGGRANRTLRAGLSVSSFILPTPTGLAGGLAPQDWRYTHSAAIRPRDLACAAKSPVVPPPPPEEHRGTRRCWR